MAIRTESLTVLDDIVKKILLEQIELAKPDDLAFLESQVSYIARLIVDRLFVSEVFSEPPANGSDSRKGAYCHSRC